MSEAILDEVQTSGSVIEKVKDTGIQIIEPEVLVPGIHPPDKDEFMQKITDQNTKYIADGLYQYLGTPFVEYPKSVDTAKDSDIDAFDKKVVDQFTSQEEKDEAYKIINRNRWKSGLISTVTSGITMFPIFLKPDNPTVETINRLTPFFQEVIDIGYKRQDKDKKLEIIRKLSKASEITLNSLMGNEISAEDWKLFEKSK